MMYRQFSMSFCPSVFVCLCSLALLSLHLTIFHTSLNTHFCHCFHFLGRLIIDGEEQPLSLMKLVKATQSKTQPNNSIIAFHDNSSAITGFDVDVRLSSSLSVLSISVLWSFLCFLFHLISLSSLCISTLPHTLFP